MKHSKLIFLIIVFQTIGLFAFSQTQIPNGCLGVNFGSSPEQTKEIMMKKDGCPKGYSKDETKILKYNPDNFAGNACLGVLFMFTNKKLYSVMVHILSGKNYTYEYNNNTFMKIYSDLTKKYGEAEIENIYNGSLNMKYSCWQDDKNIIELRLDFDSHIWIYYTNKSLVKAAQLEEEKLKNDY